LRILLDPLLEVSPSARILQGEPVLIVTGSDRDDACAKQFADSGHRVLSLPSLNGRIDLQALMFELAKLELNEVHVEAGNTLNGALLAAGYVDELLLYLAPLLVGNAAHGIFDLPTITSLDAAIRLDIRECARVGEDLRVVARPVW
jgi:diaminohydroxyphosphoribosylaminopyrimidine deaminase/5-amino-6-(5-phosphoribosylamino)uracil reductase